MPELPEVETFARDLNKLYAQKTITNIIFNRQDLRGENLDIEHIINILQNEKILSIERFAKQISINTMKGSVLVSLGMTGYFSSDLSQNHNHITIIFDDNDKLGFFDPRRFGFWKVKNKNDLSKTINPLFENELKEFFLSPKIKKIQKSIKTLLLDQNNIAGLGNIYAAETLFAANINPTKLVSLINIKEYEKLSYVIPQILKAAIDAGGSSISTYKTLSGDKGQYQLQHKVYKRENKFCLTPQCTGIIKRIIQDGRSTYYCPICQI